MMFVKFCGMTQEQDVALACELGVDAIGFVLWPGSPRATTADRVRSLVKLMPPAVLPVGVFVSPTPDELMRASAAGVRVAQIHGTEAWREDRAPHGLDVWLARGVEADLDEIPASITVLLDAQDPVRHGGTGRTVNWERAASIARRRRVLLAGGLTTANVRAAIREVRPFGVDVASGIEERPGVKNAQAMRDFVAVVREAER